MSRHDLDEQLTKYLTDAHCIEEQALTQMRSAPKLAGDDGIAQAFARHEAETAGHERTIRDRLTARGASPATVKDLVGRVSGQGFALFARLQPDTPGKLVSHAFSYEHLELAAYELLADVAERAGDEPTLTVAREIRGEEEAMGARLETMFDRAVDAALDASSSGEPGRHVIRYLADAHGLESQSIQLLRCAQPMAGPPELAEVYGEHLAQSSRQAQRLEERLRALGGAPSRVKDVALGLGALNWGLFFLLQPDTPPKLAAFAYAYEHLEIAGYELLARVAARAGDGPTESLAREIAGEERSAAEKIHARLGRAMEHSLRSRGLIA